MRTSCACVLMDGPSRTPTLVIHIVALENTSAVAGNPWQCRLPIKTTVVCHDDLAHAREAGFGCSCRDLHPIAPEHKPFQLRGARQRQLSSPATPLDSRVRSWGQVTPGWCVCPLPVCQDPGGYAVTDAQCVEARCHSWHIEPNCCIVELQRLKLIKRDARMHLHDHVTNHTHYTQELNA
jgi:hypothetical protein